MNKFENIVKKTKEKLKIKTDKELAERLNMSTSTFSERKRTNSIPHNEIIEICITENLDINEIYTEKRNIIEINHKEENIKNLENLNEKQQEYIYHLIKAELAKEI